MTTTHETGQMAWIAYLDSAEPVSVVPNRPRFPTLTENVADITKGHSIMAVPHTPNYKANRKANSLDIIQVVARRKPKSSTPFRYKTSGGRTEFKQIPGRR